MASEIQINTWFMKAIRRWPLIVGIGLMGAVFGLLVSLLLRPRYEAKATMAVNIHYGVTEPLELVVEDRALNRVAAILQSDFVIQEAYDSLAADIRSQIGLNEATDLRRSLRLDRRLAEWDLVAIDQDPALAATFAQAWAEAALLVLDEAAEHAWRALALMADNPLDVGCVPTSELVGDTEIIDWVCCVRPEDLDSENLSDELRKEIRLSRGLLPNISYELTREAQPPKDPVIWARGSFILSGTLIGLILGFWWVVFRRNSI
jgi:hypothetical protein